MPKIKQSPKLPPKKRREQLLCAAGKLFIKKGYRGTTTEQIARKAGLTKGALYYHFKKKEDILFALVQQMCWEHEHAVEFCESQPASPTDILKGLLEVHQKKDMSDFHRVVDIWAQAVRIPRIKRFLANEFARAQEDLTNRLDKRYGSSKKSRRDLATFTLAFHEGLAVSKMMNPDQIDIPKQIRLFEQLVHCSVKSGKPRGKNRGGGKK